MFFRFHFKYRFRHTYACLPNKIVEMIFIKIYNYRLYVKRMFNFLRTIKLKIMQNLFLYPFGTSIPYTNFIWFTTTFFIVNIHFYTFNHETAEPHKSPQNVLTVVFHIPSIINAFKISDKASIL